MKKTENRETAEIEKSEQSGECAAQTENDRVAADADKPDERDLKFMRLALAELENCPKTEVPVAAVVVCGDEVVGRGVNRRETDGDPTAHAEVVAIRDASKRLGRWNLSDCELFVTLEPCVMCAGAIVYSRISRVVYGAKDVRFGACGSALDITGCEKLNHRAKTLGGVLDELCLPPIRGFFQECRKNGGRKFKG